MGRKRFPMEADRGRPTVRTVAQLAGVSIASASRVLNGVGGSPELAARVRAAAERVGYVPNAIARSLQSQRTGLIGLAVADISDPVYGLMAAAIETEIAGSGRQLLIHTTGAHAAGETALIRGLARRYVDGLILSLRAVTDSHLQELSRAAVPIVVAGQLPGRLPDGLLVDNVCANASCGAALAVEHLLCRGRTRIALVNGPAGAPPSTDREEGFHATLAAHGLRALDVEWCDFTVEGGREATRRLLERTRPDAVLAANDLVAAGALHAVLSAGVRVPHEVAVVGMDNTGIAELTFPRLTSVDLGAAERGRRAARLLLSRLDDGALPARSERVAPALVVRESS